MALEPLAADIITKLADSGTLPNRRVLCLGYPDILTTGDPPPDAERQSIAKWHHWHGGIEHAEHFFGRQSLTAEYWDVVKARGPERIVDLNSLSIEPGSPYSAFAGLVVDPGTLEHVFNLAGAWRAVAATCAVGGYILNLNPLSLGNHGFWSLHPTAYSDFYTANGFNIEMMAELSGPLDKRTIRAVPATKRFAMAADATMLCLARKEREVSLTWPKQSKYVANPMLKGAA